MRAFELPVWIDALPCGEELEEGGGGDGFDILAEAVESVAVDAGQEAALAPGFAALEAGLEDGAFVLEVEEEGLRFIADLDARIVFEDGAEGFEAAEEDFLVVSKAVDGEPATVFVFDAFLLGEGGEPVEPWACFVVGDKAHPLEGVVDFFERFGLGPDFLADAVDGGGVERADVILEAGVQAAAGHDRLGAAFFEGCIVEEGVDL